MLFNSYIFIFLFCPIVYAVYFSLGNKKPSLSTAWLLISACFFYSWWNYFSLFIIIISMIFNYCVSRQITLKPEITSKIYLKIGIFVNLAVLCYFKYEHFFLNQWYFLTDQSSIAPPKELPLGISFFTFVQIAYLVDAYRKEVLSYNFIDYSFFVTYFPHLVAGPIIHHKDILPKTKEKHFSKFNYENFSIGVVIFSLGLFKKVIIADYLAPIASQFFDASTDIQFTPYEAFFGMLAYTLQIYFDFSGYSDMAIGLAKALNLPIPANFYSPYKSLNIIDFWHRWHISLSRFLRDYLYIPLGGNRKGTFRRYINLTITMLIGGFWHGAGWNFIIWGALHGLYLIVNHFFQSLKIKVHKRLQLLTNAISCLITFISVMFAWVFFRANSFESAINSFKALFGYQSKDIGKTLLELFPVLESYGYSAGPKISELTGIQGPNVKYILLCLFICFFAPNTMEITSKYSPAIGLNSFKKTRWNFNLYSYAPVSALIITIVLFVGLISIHKESVFLYFQF